MCHLCVLSSLGTCSAIATRTVRAVELLTRHIMTLWCLHVHVSRGLLVKICRCTYYAANVRCMCITFAEHHTCTPAWLNIKGPTAVSTRRIGDKMSGHVINTELFTPRTSAKIIISPEVVETVSFHKQTLSITPASHITISLFTHACTLGYQCN